MQKARLFAIAPTLAASTVQMLGASTPVEDVLPADIPDEQREAVNLMSAAERDAWLLSYRCTHGNRHTRRIAMAEKRRLLRGQARDRMRGRVR